MRRLQERLAMFAGLEAVVPRLEVAHGVQRVEDQAFDPFRMGRSEEHDRLRPLVRGEDRRALGSDRVQDHTEVVGDHLEGRQVLGREPVGDPAAAAVHDDEPAERAQPPQEMGVRRELPVPDEVRREARNEQQIGRSVTHHLVRDVTPSGVFA